MRLRPSSLCLLAFLVCLSASTRFAFAIAPPVLSDEELAKAPIIVLGRWDENGTIERHDDIDGNFMRHGEAHLELVVERSIVGDLKPGRHPLLLKHYGGIAWDESGRPSTGMSTDIPGDVDDVRVNNLWFLAPARSWDPKVKTPFLAPFGFHRSIQEPKFEPWYAALRPPAKDAAIAPFLASADAATALRALEVASGGIFPWPFTSEFEQWLLGEARSGEGPSRARRRGRRSATLEERGRPQPRRGAPRRPPRGRRRLRGPAAALGSRGRRPRPRCRAPRRPPRRGVVAQVCGGGR